MMMMVRRLGKPLLSRFLHGFFHGRTLNKAVVYSPIEPRTYFDRIKSLDDFDIKVRFDLSYLVYTEEYRTFISMLHDARRQGLSGTEILEHTSGEIICYCHLNQLDLGFSVLGRSFKLGYDLNGFTYDALLKGLWVAGKASEARDLFKKVSSGENNFLYLQVQTISGTMVNGLCESGSVLEARDLLVATEDLRCDVEAYSSNIWALLGENGR